MIRGRVRGDGVPVIQVEAAGQQWQGLIDTGFNGDLELPRRLGAQLNAQPAGRVASLLAANQQIEEDVYLVDFPFDGRFVRVHATIVDGDEILIGTGLLREYRLEIDFPARTVLIDKA